MFFLCLCIFFPSVFTSELTTQPNGSEQSEILNISANLTTALKNETVPQHNTTIITQRITQPSKKIERVLHPMSSLSSNDSRKVDSHSKNSSFVQFRPSPQLETYYEYNKFPVTPALPEAKTFGGFSNFLGHSLNSWNEISTSNVPWSNNNRVQNSWYENSKGHGPWDQNFNPNLNPTTEQPWNTRVKFPEKENPYPFVSSDEKLNSYYPPTKFPTTTEGFSFNKPVEIPNKNFNKPHKPSSGPGFWQKLMGIDNSVNKNGVAAQKTFFDYNLMEKPPHYDTPIKEHETGLSFSSNNPWTKIIKLLTTVIPIGLFISALTPTVISVTAVNDTQSRYRADISNQELTDRLSSSLKYAEQIRSCEDKILCELLVTAIISKNSVEHINNLLDNFTEHEDLANKKDDLLKIFEAAKKEDCSAIVCKTTNN